MNIHEKYQYQIDDEFDNYKINDVINDKNGLNPFHNYFYAIQDNEIISVSFYVVSVHDATTFELIKTYNEYLIDEFKNDYTNKNLIFVDSLCENEIINKYHLLYDISFSCAKLHYEHDLKSQVTFGYYDNNYIMYMNDMIYSNNLNKILAICDGKIRFPIYLDYSSRKNKDDEIKRELESEQRREQDKNTCCANDTDDHTDDADAKWFANLNNYH